MPKGEEIIMTKTIERKKERKKGTIIFNSHRFNDCANVCGM